MLRTLMKGAAIAAVALAATSAAAQELTVATANLSAYIDPGKDHSNVGSQQYYNAFDTLIEKDHTKTEPVWLPGLAVSWEQITPRLLELKLRRGVKFHDGSDLTADDVVFSLQRMFDPAFPPYITRHNEYFENMYRVEKVDAETIRILTKKPEPLFETLLNVQQSMILPKAYVMGLTGHPEVDENSDYEAFGLKPVGTGPYKIVEFIPGERLVYERFDDFWGDAAPFQRITLRRIPELSARITALKNGEVDIITNLPPDQLGVVESDPNLKVVGAVTPIFHVVFFNTNNPKVADKRLRQALSYAIDRETLNQALWLGRAVVPSTHTYPQFGKLYMPELNTFEFDPKKAKALLEEVGYEGEPIRYDTFPVYYTNGLLAAQAIQEMWGSVGVKMDLQVNEKWTGGDPDMESRNWSNPLYFPDPAGSFGTMWSPSGARVTAGTWSPKPEYTEMWNRFRYSTDVEARKAAYAEIMAYVKEEAPFIPLYQPYESYGMKQSVNWKPLPGHIPYVLDFRAGRVNLAQR